MSSISVDVVDMGPLSQVDRGCLYEAVLTSVQVVLSASQSRRGSRETRISGLYTTSSSCASSASLGCRGNDLFETLQALTAQDRKFRFSTLIVLRRVGFLNR